MGNGPGADEVEEDRNGTGEARLNPNIAQRCNHESGLTLEREEDEKSEIILLLRG
jgi:hypothetical protein